MECNFTINTELDVPIYQQLVDSIGTEIKKGHIMAGHQLPTVYEMTQRLNIARGTIKRAYDELEREGLVEKVQGRGTFVSYNPSNSASRKEQAMAAIDSMLNQLEDMGFSATEINIFINLKLRERSEEEAQVKVAVVECNPETLSQISEQLRHTPGVDLYSYMLENIREYPYKLSEEFDLIVTTANHATYLEDVLPIKKKLARIALRPSPRCLSHIIKLRSGTKVGIVGYSIRFGALLYEACHTYAEDVVINEPNILSSDEDLDGYIENKDVILVPKNYKKYFSVEAVEKLRSFRGELIECYYEMDEGSLIYLEAKIKRLIEKKTI